MKKEIEAILPGIVDFRRQLHRIPELAGEEFATMKLIRDRLAERLPLLTVEEPYIGTDTVALLMGKGPGRNITLRADIDALAIDEATGREYASRRSGMMHACGHDGHTAILMGAAEILAARRHEFSGSVRFVWQPGEENKAMAKELVEAGALENPKADLVTALHGMPSLPAGHLGVKAGAMMASCAHFKVTVKGKGGHSSIPYRTHDPVIAAASLVVELQTIVSRRISALEPAVLSVCRIDGGKLANVIPDEVVVEGTARAINPEVALFLEREFRQVTEAVCRAHHVEAVIEYHPSYPVTVNPPGPTELARRAMRLAVGEESVVELEHSSLGAEDFAYYLLRYPGVYVKLGVGEDSPALHNSRFDFNDAALAAGIEYLVQFTLLGLAS